ncbi:MAG: hypothetical protein MRZ79_14965 [Bacteroidia bacterium]|nr:hypothetical protein [Bacteroidia bacterium]
MYRYLLPAIVVIFWGSQLYAQQYSGRGEFTIETQGSQATTILSSQQVAGKLDLSQHTTLFYFKTLSLVQGDDFQKRKFVLDVLQAEAYPIIRLEIISDKDNNAAPPTQAIAELTFMGKKISTPISMSHNDYVKEKSMVLDGQFSIDLSKQGIEIPAEFKNQFGSELKFNFNNFQLKRP